MARASLALLALALLPGPAPAQITLHDDGWELELGGYLRAFTGLHDRGYDIPLDGEPSDDRTSGLHSQLLRVRWLARGDGWALELHNRLQARVATVDAQQVVGIGVSALPDRLVDLRSELVDGQRLDVWHDIDRLALTVFTPAVDVTVGRQAITWGTSALFPVADLWAAFSPFEQDTEEKAGVDAVRALFSPTDRLEMDAVVAHRGSSEDLSAGVRGVVGLPSMDLWAGAGKFWRQMMVLGGATVLLDETRLRAEAVLPYNLDREELLDPRVTLGADWLRGSLAVTAEYHFNGLGSSDTDRYAAVAATEPFQRGESYYLGRHYLGTAASWSPDVENRWTLALTALVNAGDGSAALTPMTSYDLGQSARVTAGALLATGATPAITLDPPALDLRSEFGAYGSLAFTTIALFF